MRHMIIGLAAILSVGACSGGGPGGIGADGNIGTVKLAATGSAYDVAEFAFSIHDAGDSCADPPITSSVVPLEDGVAPPWINGAAGHRFSNALFVLPPGDYRACARPLQAGGAPSAVCQEASDLFAVTAGSTNEVVLASPCSGDVNGALDIVAILGDPPIIDDLDIAPSKFIGVCQSATITAAATDSNGNPVTTFNYEVVTQPAGSNPSIDAAQNPATFSTDTVGPYEVKVTAVDDAGSESTLTFPIHAIECDDLLLDASRRGLDRPGRGCGAVRQWRRRCGGPIQVGHHRLRRRTATRWGLSFGRVRGPSRPRWRRCVQSCLRWKQHLRLPIHRD